MKIEDILNQANEMLDEWYEDKTTALGPEAERQKIREFVKIIVKDIKENAEPPTDPGSASAAIIGKGLGLDDSDEVVVPKPTSTRSPLTQPGSRGRSITGTSLSELLDESRERERPSPSGGRFR